MLSFILSLFLVAGMYNPGDFTFEVNNTTTNVCYFEIYWIDHPFVGFQGEPAIIAGGELDPGEVFETDPFPPGSYMIIMLNAKTGEHKSGLFKFIDGTGKVLITWEGVVALKIVSLEKICPEPERFLKYDSNNRKLSGAERYFLSK